MVPQKKRIYGWDAYRLEEGPLALSVVPDLGGRIISLVYAGEELLFVQKEHAGETFDFPAYADLCLEKKKLGFRVWGGDKTWVAPEKLWWEGIPPLDLDAGRYSIDLRAGQVIMTSPVCRETGLKVTRSVALGTGERVFLKETLTNAGREEATRGVWNVSQVLRPLDVYLPIRKTALRLYDDAAFSQCRPDEVLEEHNFGVKVSCRGGEHFKFGGLVDYGLVVALHPGPRATIVWARSFDLSWEGAYAHGSSVEVYNSPFHCYCEVEVHSPLARLMPGESVSLGQTWTLKSFPVDIPGVDIARGYFL